MSTNPFDQILHGSDTQQLDGLFSKLKKAVKKLNPVNVLKKTVKGAKSVHKSHINAVKNPKAEIRKQLKRGVKHIKDVDKFRLEAERKIDRTLYGKKLGDKLIKIRHSKTARTAELVVGAAVATYFGGPLAGKAIMGMTKGAITKGAIAKIAPKLVSGGVSLVSKQLTKKKQEEAANAQQAAELEQATQYVLSELTKDIGNVKAIQNDPEFINTVRELIKRGASWEEIEAAWANSDTFQHLVRTQVPRTAQPLIYADMVNAGIPAPIAQHESYIQAHEMVDAEADKIAAQHNTGKGLLALIPLALLFLN